MGICPAVACGPNYFGERESVLGKASQRPGQGPPSHKPNSPLSRRHVRLYPVPAQNPTASFSNLCQSAKSCLEGLGRNPTIRTVFRAKAWKEGSTRRQIGLLAIYRRLVRQAVADCKAKTIYVAEFAKNFDFYR